MSKTTDKSAAAKTATPAPAPKAKAPPKAKADKPKASEGKVQVIFDNSGKGDADNAIALLEKAGFEVSTRKVDEIYNYMSHEDKVYVPSNLAGKSDKALGILRKVRSQLVDVETTEDDTVFAWFIR